MMRQAFPSFLLGLSLVSTALAAGPFPEGAVAKDYGKIGAGEGPAWWEGSLYFTDGEHVNRLDTKTGQTSVFMSKCGSPNGLYFDTEGRLIMCESNGRRLSRREKDGKITVLAGDYQGKRYNSPNDVSLDSHGRIYFTDPQYGPRNDMQIRDAQGRPVEGVFRVDAPGQVTLVLALPDVDRPNGILISPDDKYMYICDNNNNVHGGSRKVLRFDLKADGTVNTASRKVIFDWKASRGPDGMKQDSEGRLYVLGGLNRANEYENTEFKAGCYVLSPEGKLLQFIPTGPDEATNCAFGGEDFMTLYMTSGNHLWSIPLTTRGWKVNTVFLNKGTLLETNKNAFGIPLEIHFLDSPTK